MQVCEMGTSGFIGNMRHLTISFNRGIFMNHYNQYSHKVPSALDQHIIAYYSLEGDLEDSYWVDNNDYH